jgi:hypothetical protein
MNRPFPKDEGRMNALLLLLLTAAPAADPLPPVVVEVPPPAPPVQEAPPRRSVLGKLRACSDRVRDFLVGASSYTSGAQGVPIVCCFYNKRKIPTSPGPTPAYLWAFSDPPVAPESIPLPSTTTPTPPPAPDKEGKPE